MGIPPFITELMSKLMRFWYLLQNYINFYAQLCSGRRDLNVHLGLHLLPYILHRSIAYANLISIKTL